MADTSLPPWSRMSRRNDLQKVHLGLSAGFETKKVRLGFSAGFETKKVRLGFNAN